MKLLRSTFVAFCLATNASAFSPQITSTNSISTQQRQCCSPPSFTAASTRLYVGIHEPSPSFLASETEILRESQFRQVIKEVTSAKEYLDWLIEDSSSPSKGGSEGEEGGQTFADVIAEKAEAAASGGDVELFGGGGDAPTSSDESQREVTYNPSLRTNLGSTVLLSGTVDPTLLNILNNNFFGAESVPNFDFAHIRALVEDVPAAKKRAISREARYGGLLDKLVIEAASSGGILPTVGELDGVSSWIVQVEDGEASSTLPKVAELAGGASGLNNLVVLVSGSSDAATNAVEGWDAVVGASADGESFKCTLLTVGELHEEAGKEGGYYHVGEIGAEPPTMAMPAKLSRKKAYQLLAHSLALDCTSNKALVAYEYPPDVIGAIASPYGEGEFANRDDDGNELPDEYKDVKMESRMIQAMREVGFTQLMELDVLVGKGLTAFKEYIANPPNKENAFSKVKAERDEQDEKIMAMLDAEIAKSDAAKKAKDEEEKRIEVEGIAKEWAIKEYTLRMLGGDLDSSVSEKDFMISAWDEALREAEKTYELIHSEGYIKEREMLDKAKAGSENKLFWDGMPPTLRKKREKMVENVKRQYMDLLSEEELERIILNE